jgi:methylamine dehydrogenase accessory protein MauD
MSDIWLASYIVLWGLVVALTVVVLAMVRLVGLLYRRFPPYGARMTNVGPSIGDQLPLLEGVGLAGGPIEASPARRARLLLFVSPSCGACAELAPAIKSIWRSDRQEVGITLVGIDGDDGANLDFRTRHGLRDVPFVLAPRWAVDNGVTSTPYAVVADGNGIVRAKGVVNHLEHLDSVLRQVVGDNPAATTSPA